MFDAIINWFKSLFSSPDVKALARVAATLVVANNPVKAKEVLVYLKAALLMAKAGDLTNDLFQSAMAKVATSYQDKAITAALSAFITVPNIKLGEVNQDVVDILETIISVIEAA